jgi:hypothetical protein
MRLICRMSLGGGFSAHPRGQRNFVPIHSQIRGTYPTISSDHMDVTSGHQRELTSDQGWSANGLEWCLVGKSARLHSSLRPLARFPSLY